MKLPKEGPKRRQQVFKRVYRNYEKWSCLIETEGPERAVLHIDGEDIYFYDLMEGYDALPPRQREAFDLHVLQGLSEGAAAKIMFPGSPWSTPVQQYSKAALNRMISAYDRLQTMEGRREKQVKSATAWMKRYNEWLRKAEKEREKVRRAKEWAAKKERAVAIRPREETEEELSKVREELFDD